MVRALGVIPARFASTRFPGKPLASLGERTLIEEVWRQVSSAKTIGRVIVATEDDRIVQVCQSFGAEVRLTSPEHPSGTDRVAEVAVEVSREFDVVVNVQGDEPFVTPASLDRLVESFSGDHPPEIATLAEPIDRVEDLMNPNVVKVVRGLDRRALYFSRSPIPYFRGGGGQDLAANLASRPEGLDGYLRHQGIYAYTMATLMALKRLRPSVLERYEHLEQLRALQAGLRILVLDSDFRSVGVDTPEDLERAVALLGETQR